MLVELAAANAAFSIIKRALSNGKELIDCGKAVGEFVNAKDALAQKGNRKKNSFWSRVGGKDGNDLEEFMALEKINQHETELKEAMIYTGRPGLWQDWIRFQAEARVARATALKKAQRDHDKMVETICKIAIGLIITVFICGLSFMGIVWYRTHYN
jgi:hypothetical protein